MTDSPDNLRKAAILIASLDHQSADALIAHMSPDQGQRLRRAVVQLGPIDPVEQENIVAQFVRVGPLVPHAQPAGIDLEDSLAVRLGFSPAATRLADRDRKTANGAPASTTDDPPFRFLHEAQYDELVHLLQREHPQTAAVVLAHLPPDRAAELLSALEDGLGVEVLRRLAYLDDADPETIREVERGVESWLHRRLDGRSVKTGLAAVSLILESAGSDVQGGVLSRLARRDPRLAERLSQRASCPPRSAPERAPVSFDELATWKRAALERVLAATERDLLILALAGARPEFVHRVFGVLPADLASSLADELDHLGPTSLRDIELAQSELAAIATRLQDNSSQPEPALSATA
jgi:flagellar motor switch protein FliG